MTAITIRNVPEHVRDQLAARAARRGMSLQEYLLPGVDDHGRVLAERAWELRGSVTYADACYVALAELLDAPLITLDRRLAQAPGPRCAFLTPPE